jgi:hypothetical protein
VRRFHTHAFWLYGVITGLAIREALVRAGPHVFLYLSASRPEAWKLHLELSRLVIFCLCLFTFYFGAGVFFDKVHVGPEAATKYPNNNYGLDYFFGLIHFVFFFGWALTIDDYSRTARGISLFLVFLTIIFLYDLAWLLANLKYDSFQEIQMWAEWAAITWFLGLVVWLLTKYVFSGNDVVAEEATFVVFGLYLIVDLVELFYEKQIFTHWIINLLPRPQRAQK